MVALLYAALLTADLILILATDISQLQPVGHRIRGLSSFDLTGEGNFAVWYSSLQLTIAAGAAFAAGLLVGAILRIERYGWWTLAGGFLALSADETAQIHERLGAAFSAKVLRLQFLTGGNPDHDLYGWIVLYVPLAVLFLLAVLLTIRWAAVLSLRSKVCMLAAACCWVGVFGAEVLESREAINGVARDHQAATEEGLELVGATLFVIAIGEHLRRERPLGSSRKVCNEAEVRVRT